MHRSVFRIGTSRCSRKTLGDFLYNNMFTVSVGEQYFKDGILDFRAPRVPPRMFGGRHFHSDGSYRTVFGPSVAHNGVIYENSDHNVSLAFSRLTAARFPKEPGKHDFYKDLQRGFIASHLHVLRHMCQLYAPHFSSYTNMDIESDMHHYDPHPKRDLRRQAWQEISESGVRYQKLWLKRVIYKMKKNEIAKPGKVPRMIGDLGPAASLQGFRVTKFLKIAQSSEPLEYLGGTIEFIATPNPFTLKRVFQNLLEPPGRFYMAYFSDDSCLSVRRKDGGVDTYNVDISKCDASHTEALFDALEEITPEIARDDVHRLTEQCGLPIEIRSVSDRRMRVILKPKHKLLYSGSTLTTAINNLANTLLGVSFAEGDYDGPDDIHAAARRVGYVVTLTMCTRPEDIQFLKHSPVYDAHGELHPLLNLGVLLRLSGTCNGDLPGRGPIKERAQAFQASLLAGAYPYTSFTVLRNLALGSGPRNSLTDKTVAKMLEYKVVESDKYPFFEPDPESLYRRYKLKPKDIVDLEALTRHGFESHFNGRAIDKILKIDYGLKSKTLS